MNRLLLDHRAEKVAAGYGSLRLRWKGNTPKNTTARGLGWTHNKGLGTVWPVFPRDKISQKSRPKHRVAQHNEMIPPIIEKLQFPWFTGGHREQLPQRCLSCNRVCIESAPAKRPKRVCLWSLQNFVQRILRHSRLKLCDLHCGVWARRRPWFHLIAGNNFVEMLSRFVSNSNYRKKVKPAIIESCLRCSGIHSCRLYVASLGWTSYKFSASPL